MKLSEFLKKESEGSREQKRWDKANTDINKDWDPPSKKQLPLQKEDGKTRKIKIEIDMVNQGTNDAMTYEDVEKIITNGFKKLKLGSRESAYVNLYDDGRDIKVGSLEVK